MCILYRSKALCVLWGKHKNPVSQQRIQVFILKPFYNPPLEVFYTFFTKETFPMKH